MSDMKGILPKEINCNHLIALRQLKKQFVFLFLVSNPPKEKINCQEFSFFISIKDMLTLSLFLPNFNNN